MNWKRAAILLSALCLVLVLLSIALAFALYERPRFSAVGGANPYIMFDQKTAQACYSGPPTKEGLPATGVGDSAGESDANSLNEAIRKYQSQSEKKNPPGLQFCSDLK